MASITIDNIGKQFSGNTVLQALSLHIVQLRPVREQALIEGIDAFANGLEFGAGFRRGDVTHRQRLALHLCTGHCPSGIGTQLRLVRPMLHAVVGVLQQVFGDVGAVLGHAGVARLAHDLGAGDAGVGKSGGGGDGGGGGGGVQCRAPFTGRVV